MSASARTTATRAQLRSVALHQRWENHKMADLLKAKPKPGEHENPAILGDIFIKLASEDILMLFVPFPPFCCEMHLIRSNWLIAVYI